MVVVDGATDKKGNTFKGKTGGRYIRDLIIDIFKRIPASLDKEGILREVEGRIKSHYKERGWEKELEEDKLRRPTASMVVYSKKFNEVWVYGDCVVLEVKENGDTEQHDNGKKIDNITSEARKIVIQAELSKGKTVEDIKNRDVGREVTQPILELQQIFQNNYDFESDMNYSNIDGFGFRSEDIKTVRIGEDVKELVFSTDGYTVLKGTLEETEEMLKGQLERDPLCVGELLSTKGLEEGNYSYDDRTYVRFKIK